MRCLQIVRSWCLVVLALALGSACGGDAPELGSDISGFAIQDPSINTDTGRPEDAVAIYATGVVTKADLEAVVLALSRSERAELSGDLVEAQAELLGELVFGQLLEAKLEESGERLGQDHQEARRQLDRDAAVQAFLSDKLKVPVPTREEVRKEFDRRRDEFQHPERRLVQHIFVRTPTGGTNQNAADRLQTLRRQAVDGQGFGVLARRFSDSESRHEDGRLGWFERGQLPQDLERVVFALKEQVPSEVVITGDGAHLFLVQAIKAKREASLDVESQELATELLEQRIQAETGRLVESLETSVEVFQPTEAELAQIRSRRDPSEVVLRVSSATLNLGQFEQLLQVDVASRSGRRKPSDRAFVILEAVKNAEVLFHHAQQTGFELRPAQKQQLEAEHDRLLQSSLRSWALESHVDESPQRLHEFFGANRQRFMSPLRVEVQRLRIPRGQDQVRLMTVLEQARERLDQTETSLEQLAPQLGGRLDRLGPGTVPEFGRLHRTLAEAVASLEPGQHSVPYSTRSHLEIVQVKRREEPSQLSFEQAEKQVRALYLEQLGQSLYLELRAAWLKDAGFEVFKERLGPGI